MAFHTLLRLLRFILTVSGCLLFSPGPVVADRDEIDVNHRHKYFQKLRLRKNADRIPSNAGLRGGNDGDRPPLIRIRPAQRSRASLFARSFVLAAIFWTVKFLLPQMSGWISRWCRDISKFERVMEARAAELRRRRRAKAHVEVEGDEGSTVVTDAVSISPSVREILDLADGDRDDGASAVSSGSMSSFFSSLGSIVRPRRRSVDSRDSRSRTHSMKQIKPKPMSPKSSRLSKRRIQKDKNGGNRDNGMPNSLPDFLHFIDEDNESNFNYLGNDVGRSEEESRSKNQWLDDVSHLPQLGSMHHKHGQKSRRKHSSASPLERKISAGSSHDSGHSRHKHNTRQHEPSQSRHHRHKERSK